MENRQKVFISYSRRDFSAVDRLRTALESADFQVLLDLSEYSGGEEWEARLKHIIGVADSVIFVLSENSAKSEICKWELDGARALHKRILSATLAPLDSMPANLLAADYIPIFEDPRISESSFESGVARLTGSLSEDRDWWREHTGLQELARSWCVSEMQGHLLLSREEVNKAKQSVVSQFEISSARFL